MGRAAGAQRLRRADGAGREARGGGPTRQLALDMLHSHSEVIQLNPLVTGVKAINAPRDAARDEFFSQWYEISEIITWGPGLKKRINFTSGTLIYTSFFPTVGLRSAKIKKCSNG